MKSFASQGQHRAAVLAFKISEMRLQHRVHGQYPILLMDDVSSELDAERNERLMAFVEGTRSQVFLTTTNASVLRLSSSCWYWSVDSGEIVVRSMGG